MKQVLIEGWRGINHSYAMVNQYQLVELVQLPNILVQHRDLPFASTGWSTSQNNPGFPDSFCRLFSEIPDAQEIRYDCVYRIAWPYAKTTTQADRALTFMTAEYGVSEQSFKNATHPVEMFCSGNDKIIVPSNWSRERFLEYGFPESGVVVVPHGVHPDFFKPLSSTERTYIRSNMGFTQDDFVFLNVGAMSWNKGLDVLLKGFAQVRKKYQNARLVLKDDRQLYGIGVQEVVDGLLNDKAASFDQGVLDSIKVLSATLPMDIMRNLYAIADTYVSAYRAEGFNLPVIESMACGTPVIVTDGGPTDDFCDDRMSRKIASVKVPNELRGIPAPGYHLEPSLESLIDNMGYAITVSFAGGERAQSRQDLLERHSWASCTRKLAALF